MSNDLKHHSLTITINFDTMNLPLVDLNVVEQMLATSRWDEGRYPFYEEMVQVGLAKLIEYAVGDAAMQAMRKHHGDKMVVDGPNSKTALANQKTQEAMKGFSAHIFDSIKAASIGEVIT